MTIDPNNSSIPESVPESEKPGLSLAMELAQFVKEEIQKLDRSVQEQVQTAIQANDEQVRVALQANAATVKRIDGLEGSVRALKGDLETRAMERVDKDFREAEARYILAREQRDRLSTQEKIEVRQLVEDRDTAAKKARTDYWRAFWDKIAPGIVTAMILAVLIPVWLAIVIAILGGVLRALGVQIPLPT